MEPTIFTDVDDGMFVAKEESFGPVMIISVFEDGSVTMVIDGVHTPPAYGIYSTFTSPALVVSYHVNEIRYILQHRLGHPILTIVLHHPALVEVFWSVSCPVFPTTCSLKVRTV